MSRNHKSDEVVLDDNGDVVYPDFSEQATSENQERSEAPALTDAEAKKEISRLNRHIVAELKSEIKTVIIALNRAAPIDELHEAAEFFADTAVDIKLVKRAIRALVKEGKLVESAKNSFELSQQKVDFYAALANLKKNPSRRLS